MTTDRIITRAEWGARYGRGTVGRSQRSEIVAHTEAGALVPRWTLEQAKARVRQIESFHVNSRKWAAIAYSFLVDPIHGWAFEGRGWDRNGSHTQAGRNSTAYAICFLGHGDHQAVTEAGWAGAELVIRDGLAKGKLTAGYAVTGHRQYAAKSCPGNLVFPHIGRLRGLTAAPPTPPTPKEWFDMATEEQLEAVVERVVERQLREALTTNKYSVKIGDRQFPLANDIAGAAINAHRAANR